MRGISKESIALVPALNTASSQLSSQLMQAGPLIATPLSEEKVNNR
jgi:hypothetical protein